MQASGPSADSARAQAALRAGDLAGGRAYAERAAAANPSDATAHHLLGFARLRAGDADGALRALERAGALGLDHSDYHFDCALALARLNRHDEAVTAFDRVLQQDTARLDALFNRASSHQKRGDPEAALRDLDACIAAAARMGQHFPGRPGFPEAVQARAALLHAKGDLKAALAGVEHVLAAMPEHAPALALRGHILLDAGLVPDALPTLETALARGPQLLGARHNLGVCLQELGRHAEAVAAFEAVLAVEPDNAEAAYNRCRSLLAQGLSAGALAAFEVRRRLPSWQGTPDGAELESLTQGPGRRVLLTAEQGLGDAIQFSRYAVALAARGAEVTVRVRAPLRRLLSCLPGVRVIAEAEPLPAYDLHAPLMSLARLFDGQPMGAAAPYLQADPERAPRWQARIGEIGYRIGIVWQGSTGMIDRGRSFPLAQFAPLAAIPGVRLIALQKNAGSEQLAHCPIGMRVETLGDDFDAGPDAFLDTAAAMQALDLVIASDTAVAHLAGALGRPVWLALKLAPDWRWGTAGAQTPWYPTMRLFRQADYGDWDGVFALIADAVRREAR